MTMSGRPRRLGRGLAALVDQTSAEVPVERGGFAGDSGGASARSDVTLSGDVRLEGGGVFAYVPVSAVVASRYQPRRVFDEAALEGLAESIRRSGMMQPVIVRRVGGSGGGYELVAGERRWRAAQRAGLAAIPAIVRDLDDRTAAEWALVENLQREDLNPIERARAFKRLGDEFGLTQVEIADSAGLQRSSVANFVRLLELDEVVLGMVEAGTLTAGHGKALLGEPDEGRRRALAEAAAGEGWTVRQLEREVEALAGLGEPGSGGGERRSDGETQRRSVGDQGGTNPGGASPSGSSPGIEDLEKRLGEHLGTRVRLKVDRSGTKGSIVVAFYGLDHFDGVMERMGVEWGGGVRGGADALLGQVSPAG